MAEEQKGLTKQDWQNALDSQNAINGGALVRALGRVIDKIQHECRAKNGATECWNKHPIMVLYLTQLAELAGGYVNWPPEVYTKAYKEVLDHLSEEVDRKP